MEKKTCPIALAAGNRTHCLMKNCAWWIIYWPGENREYGECAMVSLTCLMDGIT